MIAGVNTEIHAPINETSSALVENLKRCLENIYQLDSDIIEVVLAKVSCLFKDNSNQRLIDDFLFLSKNVVLTHPAQQILSSLGKWDAVIAAPQAHRVLFENDRIRILEAVIRPNETVPFHSHQWDSIMIILQGSTFRSEDSAGSISEETWGMLVEKMEGSFSLGSYSNIGSQVFKSIAFEIKK